MFKRPVVALPVFKPEQCHSPLPLGASHWEPPCQVLWKYHPDLLGDCEPGRDRTYRLTALISAKQCTNGSSRPLRGSWGDRWTYFGNSKEGAIFSRSFSSCSVTGQPRKSGVPAPQKWSVCQLPISFPPGPVPCSFPGLSLLFPGGSMPSVCLGWALDFEVNWSIILR